METLGLALTEKVVEMVPFPLLVIETVYVAADAEEVLIVRLVLPLVIVPL